MWRALIIVALALVLGSTGSVCGAVLRWRVIEPSDAELLAVAGEMTPSGFELTEVPVIDGRWAPSFDRGSVRWAVSSEDERTIATVRDDLRTAGWEIGDVEHGNAFDSVDASRDRMRVDLTLRSPDLGPDGRGRDEGGTRVELTLQRGERDPTAQTVVLVGAALGLVAGTGVGVALTRPRRRRSAAAASSATAARAASRRARRPST